MHPSFRWPIATAAALAFHAFAASAQIDIADAWARATVPGQQTAGAFMQLRSTTDLRLVGASSPLAKIVEIHEMKLEAGMMKMRAVDAVDLPAGKAIALSPGGRHVMMMGLAQPLNEGDSVPLTLTFEDKSGKRQQLDVRVLVRGLTAQAPKPRER